MNDAIGKTYANIAAILRPKTPQEAEEEKQVEEAAARVKASASRKAPSPPTSAEITHADVPF